MRSYKLCVGIASEASLRTTILNPWSYVELKGSPMRVTLGVTYQCCNCGNYLHYGDFDLLPHSGTLFFTKLKPFLLSLALCDLNFSPPTLNPPSTPSTFHTLRRQHARLEF
jgi:hypothetical protein